MTFLEIWTLGYVIYLVIIYTSMPKDETLANVISLILYGLIFWPIILFNGIINFLSR